MSHRDACLSVWSRLHRPLLRALARDVAAGSPRSAAFADYLQHSIVERLQEALGQDRGRVVSGAIVGTLFARYVIWLPAFTRMRPEDAAHHLLPAFGGRP